jgi:hypothetical protein
MSDPSSAFLAVAFVAGIIEGSSILRHHKSALRTSEAPTSLSIAAHSFLYGAVSLPLGVIGASPGNAFYPNALKQPINAQESSISDEVQEKIDLSSKTEDAKDNGALAEAQIQHSSGAGTGRGIGRFLRDKNLKKTHHGISQHQELTRPVAGHLTNTPIKLRLISTLDGHALPTPLSEAMRRSRCLFVGAALISFGIIKCVSSNHVANKSDETIIDGHGRIQRIHCLDLERRLRLDTELAKPNKWVLTYNIHQQINSSIEKVQTLALSCICGAIKPIQSTPGGSFILPLYDWLLQWRDLIAMKREEENNPRPIAIRLVPNDTHATSSCRRFHPPPPKEVEDEANGHRNHPFFVLPMYLNQYKPPYLWWQLDSETKSFEELPLNSTWLVNNDHQNVCNGAIIVEANTSPSIYHALQSLNTKSSYTVGPSLRMLLNRLRTKCPDGTTTIAVLIHDNEKPAHWSSTKEQFILIDSLDVVKWAVLSAINKMNLESNAADIAAATRNHELLSASTQINKRLTKYNTDKDDATPWTIVDVIGTSIRHLLESAYRIASAVTYQNMRTKTYTEKRDTSKKAINIVSPSNATTEWLKNSLQSHGWKVTFTAPDRVSDKTVEGIVLIMGRDDFETYEITSSIIKDIANTRVVMLLENDGFVHTMLDEDIQEKATIVCASAVYELAFSTARSLLAKGMDATEVQVEVDTIFSITT